MKKCALILAVILACLSLPVFADTNYSTINFAWSFAGTTASNAYSYIIHYGTNSGVYFGSTNVSTNTSITVQFPHGIQWYYRIQPFDINSNQLPWSAESTYGYNVPVPPLPPPIPAITVTVVQP